MVIRRLPANDNDECFCWVCTSCSGNCFLLEFEGAGTIIRCAVCREDVTQHVIPTLEIPKCQP
jgi:hypothetical protein